MSVNVVEAFRKETGKKFRGILYGGFMITKQGVKLIEYNVRFGDPEAMNALPTLETDFIGICQALVDEKLDTIKIKNEKKATVCKYVVPEGYPVNPVKGKKIEIGDVSRDVKVYYASVDQKDDGLYMSSSRAVAFVGIADTIPEAEHMAQKAVASVKGPVFFRKDIGTKELIEKRIGHMKEVRG